MGGLLTLPVVTRQIRLLHLSLVTSQVRLTHAQAAEHSLVELRVGTAGEEGVELVEDVDVRILAMRRLSMARNDYHACVSMVLR